MDMSKYEEIDGWQVLEQFKEGKVAFCYYGGELHEVIMVKKHLYSSPVSNDGRQRLIRRLTVNEILERKWYKKKPFDVRQAMLDRPNEWVGAFFDEGSESWRKVGFDFKNFKAIEACIKDDVVTDFYKYGVAGAVQEELDACIPIEDVPEEARE